MYFHAKAFALDQKSLTCFVAPREALNLNILKRKIMRVELEVKLSVIDEAEKTPKDYLFGR